MQNAVRATAPPPSTPPRPRAVIDEDAINALIADLKLRVSKIKDDCLYLDFTVSEGQISEADMDVLPSKLVDRLSRLRIPGITKISIG